MITHTAMFLLLALYLIVPIALYCIPHKRMAQFCFYMTCSDKCRRFYCLMLLLGVIYMHFTYYNGHRGEYAIMVSSLVIIPMFSRRFTENILILLTDDIRKLWIFSILTLLTGFIPHMFTMCVTMAMFIVGASFYPSREIRSLNTTYLFSLYNKAILTNDYKTFVQMYFR